ncbi:MAG: hypothetical protein Q4D62_15530 [Planctomycetia bacterium]|nr:hypothetical protein [Planctomycetia bacterium]
MKFHKPFHHQPCLGKAYRRYLRSADAMQFREEVLKKYTPGTLEKLVFYPQVQVRRAAILALGMIGDFSCQRTVARVLRDSHGSVVTLAEQILPILWKREGTLEEQRQLQRLTEMVCRGDLLHAVTMASVLMEDSPHFTEFVYQRGMAWFGLGHYPYALEDFQQVLRKNPYHYKAAVLAGHCFMELGQTEEMIWAFRQALEIHPGLKKSRLPFPQEDMFSAILKQYKD